MKAELFRSKLRYFRKQYGTLSAQWLRLVFSTSILAKLGFYRLRRRRAQVALWKDTWTHFRHPQPRPEPVQPRARVAHARPASRARVMIFGLDGGTFDVVKPLIAQGRLPHLARLMQGGTHGILNSTQPPITPTAWTSFATGKGPLRHQLFDFERFVPGTYQTQPVAANRHGQHSIWRIASEHDKRVIALDIPFSYPPEAVNGCLVAGYGVPLGTDTRVTY